MPWWMVATAAEARSQHRRNEQLLEHGPWPWEDVQRIIQSAGITDPRFHGAAFWRQPTRDVYSAHTWALKEQARRANRQSRSTAALCAMVSAFMSGGKSNATESMFLPCRDPDRDDDPSVLSYRTQDVIKKAISSGRIPPWVIQVLAPDMEVC